MLGISPIIYIYLNMNGLGDAYVSSDICTTYMNVFYRWALGHKAHGVL